MVSKIMGTFQSLPLCKFLSKIFPQNLRRKLDRGAIKETEVIKVKEVKIDCKDLEN